MPSASTSRLRLAPFLARSVGFFPVFFPPERRLGHAPVHAHPGPIDALQVVVGHQAGLPQVQEDAGLDPLLEAVMGRRSGTELGGVEGLPLAAGAEHEEDGVHADAVGGAGPAAAEAVRVLVFGDQQSDGLPEVVGNAPVIRNGTFVHEKTCA
jgi:hypothetical protein